MNYFRSRWSLLVFFVLVFVQCNKDDSEPSYEDGLKKDLWAYYDFNENLNDKSGNNRNCVGYNGIKLTYDIWGNDNEALDFDGIDDYAVINEGNNFDANDFTVCFLAMPKDTRGRIFQKADVNTAKGASFGIGFDDNINLNELVFNVSKEDNVCDNFIDITNSTPLFIPQILHTYAWYFITCKFEKGIETVYFNGKVVATQPTPKSPVINCSNAPFHLGIWWVNDLHPYNGKLDELRIYSRALSDEEIKYLAGSALHN